MSSHELDANWDPMAKDYYDPNFNTYNEGPGSDLPKSRHAPNLGTNSGGPRDIIQLYVQGIPRDMTQEGLTNLFSRAGKVVCVRMAKRKEDENTTFGFVTMKNTHEAEQAIKKFDNFQIQDGRYKLRVALAKPRGTESEQQRRKKQEDEEFLNKLNCAKNGESRKGGSDNGLGPVAVGMNGIDPPSERPAIGRASKVIEAVTETPKPGNPSPVPKPKDQTPPSQRPVVSPSVNKGSTPGRNVSPKPHVHPKPCTVCGKQGTLRCQRCKTPYCGVACQKADWTIHKPTCVSRTLKSASSVSSLANSDFESRFDVDFGDDMAAWVAQTLSTQVGVELKVPKCGTEVISTTASKSQSNISGKQSPQDIKRKPDSPSPVAGPPTSNQSPNAVKTPYKRLMYKDANKVKLSTESQVVMMSVDNPGNFSVVLASSLQDIENLKNTMNQHYANTTNIGTTAYCPEIGQICAGQFSCDKNWYRARVDRILLDGNMALTYVDYGNKEEIPLVSVRRLEAQFMDLPLQAVTCCLNDVTPPGGEWSKQSMIRAIQLMKLENLYTTKLCSVENDIFHVDIIGQDGSSVTEVLMTEGLVHRKGAKRPVKETKEAGEQSTSSKPVTRSAVLNIPPPPRPTAAKYLSKNTTIQIIIINPPSPNLFWCQVMDKDVHELPELQDRLFDHYSKMKPKTGFTPLGDKLYACKYAKDNAWYRAHVVDFDTQTAKVIYLDFGNRATVPFSFLHSLESPFMSLPFQAVRCSLYGISPFGETWSKEALQFFASNLPRNVTSAKVCDKDDVITFLDVLCEDGETMSSKLVKAGYAMQTREFPIPPKPSEAFESKCKKEKPKAEQKRVMVGDLPKLTLTEKEILVMVSYAPSPTSILAQAIDEGKLKSSLLQVINTMAACKQPAKPYVPLEGEIVAAQFMDQDWYRGEVKKVDSASECYVYFLDYGNLEKISTDLIGPLPAGMEEHPPLGISCRMAGIEENPNIPWDTALLVQRKLLMSVVSKGIEKYDVEFTDPETGVSVNQQLIEAGMVVPKSEVNSTKQPNKTVVSVKDLELFKYSVGDIIPQFMITDASSPMDFTGLDVAKSAGPLEEMEGLLARLHVDYVGLYVPASGELVAAKYTDQLWYRASTVEVNDKMARVRLVDYGNVEQISANDINKLEPSLLKYPLLGVRCALAGIGEASAVQPWEDRHLYPQQKLFKMKIVDIKADMHIVELIDPDDNICVNKKLLDLGLVVPIRALSTEALDAKTKEPILEPSIPVKPDPQPPKKTPEPVKEPAKTAIEPVEEPAKPQEPVILTKQVPVQRITADNDIFLVLHFVSSSLYYAQCVAFTKSFTALVTELNAKYTNSTDVHNPVIGELVAAYCNDDGAWYRAEILSQNNTGAQVKFVDFGNDDSVATNLIRRLEPEFSELPIQAIPFSFDKKYTFTEQGSAELKTKMTLKMMGFVLAGEESGIYQVTDVYDCSTMSSLVEELIQQGLASNEQPLNITPTQSPPTSAIFMLNDIPYQHLPDGNVKVSAMVINSPDDFFLQLCEEWCENKLTQVYLDLNRYCNQAPVHKPQKIGEVVCALYQNCWFRGSVEEIMDNNYYKINYFDYGNTEVVPGDDIRPIKEELMGLPRQGIPCGIAFIKGTTPQGTWTEAAKNWFTANLLEKKVALKPTSKREGDRHIIDLLIEGGVAASKMMIDGKLAQLSTTPVTSPQVKQVEIKVPDPPPPQRVTEQPICLVTNLPEQKVSASLDVVVIDVRSPGQFYCQHASEQAVIQVATIREELLKFCQGSQPEANFKPKPQQLCAVYHKGYNEWFRAVVQGDDGQAGTCQVQFIDYGDVASIEMADLRPLPDTLLQYPKQAICCRLADLGPIGPNWQVEACKSLRMLVIDKGLMEITVCGTDGTAYLVSLVSKGTNKNINEELVEQGLAVNLKGPCKETSQPTPVSQQPPVAPLQSSTDVHAIQQENLALKQQLSDLQRQMAEFSKMIQQKQ